MKRYTAKWRDGDETKRVPWQPAWNMPDQARLIHCICREGRRPLVYHWNGTDWLISRGTAAH
jgi:hypothetical protein